MDGRCDGAKLPKLLIFLRMFDVDLKMHWRTKILIFTLNVVKKFVRMKIIENVVPILNLKFCLNSLCQISWDWKLKLLRIFTFSIFVCRVWWWFLFYSVSYMRMAPCPMSRQWTIKTTDRRVIFTQLLSESLGSRTLRLNHSSLLFHQILVPDQ